MRELEEIMRARAILLTAILVFVASCNQHPEASNKIGGSASEIRTMFDDSSNAPYELKAGNHMTGVLVSPGTMHINEFGLQVATNGKVLDGEIQLKICQSGLCRVGSVSLAAAKDNDFLWIKLSSSLPVTYSEGAITYDITRSAGVREFYIWIYPAYGDKSYLEVNGAKISKAANIIFRQY